MTVQALAGTAAAAQPCRCGHTRIRHQAHGHGRCTATTIRVAAVTDGPAHRDLVPCRCAMFTPQERN